MGRALSAYEAHLSAAERGKLNLLVTRAVGFHYMWERYLDVFVREDFHAQTCVYVLYNGSEIYENSDLKTIATMIAAISSLEQ